MERHVTALEDEAIREVALGPQGPDTTTRVKIVWHGQDGEGGRCLDLNCDNLSIILVGRLLKSGTRESRPVAG